jgi:hypothetical protein
MKQRFLSGVDIASFETSQSPDQQDALPTNEGLDVLPVVTTLVQMRQEVDGLDSQHFFDDF